MFVSEDLLTQEISCSRIIEMVSDESLVVEIWTVSIFGFYEQYGYE
jgi:hypothetical protein